MTKGWYGHRQQHSLASKGIKSKTKAYGKIKPDLLKQVKQFKFPLKFEIDVKTINKFNEEIDEYAEGDKDVIRRIKNKMKVVKINQSELLDYTGWKEDFYDVRKEVKEEYREERRQAKDEGWLDEFPDYDDWIWDSAYPIKMDIKWYVTEYLDDEQIQEQLNSLKEDIHNDLWYDWIEL